MSEKLYVKNPLFPMAGIAVSVFTFVFGLAIAKSPGVFFFLGGIWLLLALFGYLRPCLAVLPAAALLCGIFCALTYAISRDAAQTSAAAARMLALCVAAIPGLGLAPSALSGAFPVCACHGY